MPQQRPCVLSVAGFDPSGGAGVLADIKTFEMHRLTGLGVATAITYQHESSFRGIDWLPEERVMAQIDVLAERYAIAATKIGIVETPDMLIRIVERLLAVNPHMSIVWDPVLRASAGFRFHNNVAAHTLECTARALTVVTPNWQEMTELVPGMPALQAAEYMSQWCAVFLKGGHNVDAIGYDYLVTRDATRSFRPHTTTVYPKHGSGCVLSAALASAIANGYTLHSACLRAKQYTARFLESTPGLLGFHKR